MNILIVTAPYYAQITDRLLSGALGVLEAQGASHELVSVPGALEIPPAIAMRARDRNIAGFIALGCVIRGETSHYDIVAGESARALMSLAVDHALAIGNGILTVDSMEQARARAGAGKRNKGGDAAKACLALARLKRSAGS